VDVGFKQSILHNLNDVRRKANGHFRKKEEKYLNAEIDELETNIKIKI
jgi:hypothetical protein